MSVYDLCVVTDARLSRGRDHVQVAEAAVRGGATMIQLREKEASTRSLVTAGEQLRAMTRGAGVPLIVNDRIDVTLAVDADGVHVGQDDMLAALSRRLIGPGRLLGVSATTLDEALCGEQDGADYLGVGPIFPTGSKADAAPPMGLDGLAAVAAQVRLPVIAIGGISLENVEAVIEAGADGVAVISAVVSAPDIESAARLLRARITAAKSRREAMAR